MSRDDDIEQLYKDAVFIHLVQKGFSDFMAEYQTNRLIQKKKEL